MSVETMYWGILCRSCSEPVAFDTGSHHEYRLGSANASPGAIRCINGHNHIYFPRDFRFFPSSVSITETTVQENRQAYLSINPSTEPSCGPPPGEPLIPRDSDKSDIRQGGLSHLKVAKARPASLVPDPRRQVAQMAAKARWKDWASKKAV
jgi:hypothetical protein